jgi:hypothetical protein
MSQSESHRPTTSRLQQAPRCDRCQTLELKLRAFFRKLKSVRGKKYFVITKSSLKYSCSICSHFAAFFTNFAPELSWFGLELYTLNNADGTENQCLQVYFHPDIESLGNLLLFPCDEATMSISDKLLLASSIVLQPADISLVRKWLRLCRASHNDVCEPLANFLWTQTLRVIDRQIKQL